MLYAKKKTQFFLFYLISDVFTLTSGLHEPLLRNRQEIRNFVRTRVLEGAPEPENIRRGTDRLILEMQPFLEHFVRITI